MNKNYYDILGVAKNATADEIKKSYKKLAMKYHPDRNKGDKEAEKKFKEINEAYQTLGDEGKKKQYDTFGTSDFNSSNGFSGGFSGFGGGNTSSSGFSGFDFGDIFGNFGGGNQKTSSNFDFDFSDLFSGKTSTKSSQTSQKTKKEEPENLDVIEKVEIPFLDFLLDTQVFVKTVYGKNLTLKIKAGTKPGTKFKIKGEGRQNNGKTGDMFVIVEAKMPKEIPEKIKKIIESIKYEL